MTKSVSAFQTTVFSAKYLLVHSDCLDSKLWEERVSFEQPSRSRYKLTLRSTRFVFVLRFLLFLMWFGLFFRRVSSFSLCACHTYHIHFALAAAQSLLPIFIFSRYGEPDEETTNVSLTVFVVVVVPDESNMTETLEHFSQIALLWITFYLKSPDLPAGIGVVSKCMCFN